MDLTGSIGLGKGAQGAVRAGTSGLEATFLRQLTNPENRWFAMAAVLSGRGRLVFDPGGEAARIVDLVLSTPLEFDPHPRLALIVEPKGMLSLATGIFGSGGGGGYYPFHAGVSGGARLRTFGGLVIGAEGAWYPIPILHHQRVGERPTSWEAAISVSWIMGEADRQK